MDWYKLTSYGFYVWGAYGVVALALALELLGLRRSRRDTEGALSDFDLVEKLEARERAESGRDAR